MERQVIFSEQDEMLYNEFDTASPDGEADAEVASDTTEDPQGTAALPEPEGAAEKDDTETLRQILSVVIGEKNASDLIKKIKKDQELWAQLRKSVGRLRDGEGIKIKKIGQSIHLGGKVVSAAGEYIFVIGGAISPIHPAAGEGLIAVSLGMMTAGKGTEISGAVVQRFIDAHKAWRNEDYVLGDVSKCLVRDGKDVKEIVRYITGKDASEYKFGDITRAVFRKGRKMARGRGSRKPPKQAGG